MLMIGNNTFIQLPTAPAELESTEKILEIPSYLAKQNIWSCSYKLE